MKLTEQIYEAHRGENGDEYQDLTAYVEMNNNRRFIRFGLMEQRWRSKEDAASYLEWAAGELRRLPV